MGTACEHVLGDPPNRPKKKTAPRNAKSKSPSSRDFELWIMTGTKPWHLSDLSESVLKGRLGFSVEGPTKSRSCAPTGPRHRQLRLTQICRLLMINPSQFITNTRQKWWFRWDATTCLRHFETIQCFINEVFRKFRNVSYLRGNGSAFAISGDELRSLSAGTGGLNHHDTW